MRVAVPPGRPRGLCRLLFRVPLLLYKVGLGALFGHRLVRLEHVGRRSGLMRQVVLEVVDCAQPTDQVIVVSGFGPHSDWFRNVVAHPRVMVTTGWRRQAMVAHVLSTDEGAECMVGYAHRHRIASRRIAQLLGYAVDGTDAEFADLGRRLRFVRLEPAQPC